MNGDRCFVLWYSLSDWGSKIHKWAMDSGQSGSVLTLYEIHSGDDTCEIEFHGMGTLLSCNKFSPSKGYPLYNIQYTLYSIQIRTIRFTVYK